MSSQKYFHLYTGPLDVNTYIVINGNVGFVVDPGGDAQEIYSIFRKQKAKIEAILLTHAHFDHIGGVAELCRIARKVEDGKENPQDAPTVFLHKDELEKIGSYKNMGFSMNANPEKFVPDILLKGGETLKIAGLDVKVIHTPGHAKGSLCYVVSDKIFVGDTLFFMSYGRTDFYDGNAKDLKNSIVNKLFSLKGNYTILPGHGEPTTLDFERVNNPVLEKESTHINAD